MTRTEDMFSAHGWSLLEHKRPPAMGGWYKKSKLSLKAKFYYERDINGYVGVYYGKKERDAAPIFGSTKSRNAEE